MTYASKWNSTDQMPLRAITSGLTGRLYGALDPTDGGDTERFSLSGRVAQSDAAGWWKANAYLIKSTLDLQKLQMEYRQCNSATPPPVAVCTDGVMDRVPHPVEPFAARVTAAVKF
jgi:hypothetical protein